jgi:TonB family protein
VLRMIRRCIIVFTLLVNSSSVFAQCPPLDRIADLVSRSSVDVLFSGVVVDVDRTAVAETVSLNVEWVWKGSVGIRTIISRSVTAATGSGLAFTPFELKNRYVIAGHSLTAAERENLDSDAQFGTDICGSGSRRLEAAQNELATIGPGHAPDGHAPGIQQAFAPVKIKDAAPQIPPSLIDVHGTVILEITIDASGHVRDPKVLRSIAGLDQAAIDCVMKWEYAPGLLNGVPVPVQMTVTIPIGVGPRPKPIH